LKSKRKGRYATFSLVLEVAAGCWKDKNHPDLERPERYRLLLMLLCIDGGYGIALVQQHKMKF